MTINTSVLIKNSTYPSSFLADLQFRISCKRYLLEFFWKNITFNTLDENKNFKILSLILAKIRYKILFTRFLFEKYDLKHFSSK